MITALASSYQYYNLRQKTSLLLYRLPLSSKSKAFSYYPSQQNMPQAQFPWQGPECEFDVVLYTPDFGPQCQYTSQLFR